MALKPSLTDLEDQQVIKIKSFKKMNNIKIKNKNIEALHLSSEILKNIELSEISLEKICLKCIRLARLCGDSDYETAFKREVSGYGDFPKGIPPEVFKVGKIANRVTKDDKGQESCFTASISQIEVIQKVGYKRLEKSGDPDVSISFSGSLQHIALMRKSDSILHKNTLERGVLSREIIEMSDRLSKRVDFIYSYVSKKFHKLSFEKEVYSILSDLADSIKNTVSDIIPEGGKKITSVLENLKSDNSQDWKNVLVTCRNLLKETAETLEPNSNEQYYDILKNVVNNSSLSKTDKSLMEQDITVLIDPLNEGAHDRPVSRQKAEELFIRVCLCLSKIIELNQKNQRK